MTKQIRKRVFETNSSSSHSLTLSPGDLVAQPFSEDVLRSGELHVEVGEYGWEWKRYYAPESKISYLLTQITGGNLPDEDEHNDENLADALSGQYDKFAMLCSVVKAHTGVTLVVPRPSYEGRWDGSYGYVDHESVGVGMDLFDDEEKLKQFLFTKGSYIETGNDNSGPPAHIGTDIAGDDAYYGAHYGTPAEGARATRLNLEKWPTRLTTVTGEEIGEDSPVMAQILETGVVVAVEWSDTTHYDMFRYEEPLGCTMGLLAEQGFKFVGDLPVMQRAVLKAKDQKDGKRIAHLTVMLPIELATRFPEVH